VYTVAETNVSENVKSRPKRASRSGANSATVILRGILAFAGITAALVLIGLAYTYFGWRHLDFRAFPAWFLRLSNEQWIALLVGMVAAFLMVGIPSAKITGIKVGDSTFHSPRRTVQRLAVFAVLLLYIGGLNCAYHVSLALGHSRDWAIIHSVYSWVYVGYSFSGWITAHHEQSFGQTLHEFVMMMGK
jgi:hypothetical protein